MSLNLLIVDDSAVMRSIIKKTLKLCGLPIGEIHEASNGAEGLEVLNENWIDLAMIDINMPIMNGEVMIDKVREIPELRDLAIIVVSTESSETRIQMLEKKGAEFIHKPFTPEIVRSTIIEITGVEDEQQIEEGAFEGIGPDF